MFGEHGWSGRRPLLVLVTGLALAMVLAMGQSIATASTATASPRGNVPHGVTFYVATNGNDRNNGTSLRQPVATLARAQQLVRAALRRNPGPITVDVAGSTYYLRSTLNLCQRHQADARALPECGPRPARPRGHRDPCPGQRVGRQLVGLHHGRRSCHALR